MSQSNNDIPEEKISLDNAHDSLEDNSQEDPLADLPEKLKPETIEPHFTQIFSPESKSKSVANKVKPVASVNTYEPERKPSQSNKKFLIGGGVAGIIGIILLIIIL